MNYTGRIIMIVALTTIMLFAGIARKVDIEPCKNILGNESYYGRPVPYLNDSRGPGDQIGTTYYDYQANGSFGQRIDVDDNDQAHINWMKMNAAATQRFCAWNARYADGSGYFGETPACPSWTGYVQLDITRDANPGDQRTVIDFHYYTTGNYYSWIDIDAGNLWGSWPNAPKGLGILHYVWPYVAVANNANIVMATGDNTTDQTPILHLYVTTDQGDNWTFIADFDSCSTLSQVVRASENTGSNKVVFVYTQYITDTVASGQYDNDVYYILSTDGGVNWDSPVNITNYQPYPTDSTRAYCNVNAVFDNNDDLHIAWAGRRVDNAGYWSASKIFHWDEVSTTISIVSSPSTYYSEPGGWWIATASSATPGNWRMPADQPQLVVDPNDNLYCLWHGNDDYNDGSAAGYFNGEFYIAKSVDNGVTWYDYINLTNTRSPGAGPGQCDDEDYMTACPKVVNDSIFITYIEDKDAGGYPQTEGIMTENPVRCWVFPTELAVEEGQHEEIPQITSLNLYPNPGVNVSALTYTVATSGNVTLKLFDKTGRLVNNLDEGYKEAGKYSVNLVANDLTNGTYFVILETPDKKISQSLVILH